MSDYSDHVLDNGTWLISHPDQFLATFFIPLPEPLALPQVELMQTFLRMEPASVELLKAAPVPLLLLPLDEAALSSDEPSPGLLREAENWSNKVLLSSSMLVRHVLGDIAARSGLDAAIAAARTVTTGEFPADGQMISTWQWRDQPSDELLAGAQEAGVGHVTVLEVAVPLRLVGELPDLPSPINLPLDHEHDRGSTPDHWLFEIAPADRSLAVATVAQRLQAALDVALWDIRSIVSGYHMITRHPITLVTRERLPHVLPVVIRTLVDINLSRESGSPDGLPPRLITVNANLWTILRPPDLQPEQMAALGHARARTDGEAFSAHTDLHREADVALRRHGDTRLSTLLTGVSAEALLDELLLHLQWETARTPEQAARHWKQGLLTRVKSQYAPFLGGHWSITGSGEIAEWSAAIADLRHRVVHAAYTPSVAEARRAFSALNHLVSFLCDRLAVQRVLARFPRTALALAGVRGLDKRRAYTESVRAHQEDLDEPPWGPTFVRWRQAHQRLRRDVDSPRVPDVASAYALIVRHLDGTDTWCLHDRHVNLAARAKPDESKAPPEFASQMAARAAMLKGHIPTQPVSFWLPRQHVPPLVIDGPWVEEYHLVPLAGVMVDRSDFTV